MKKSASKKNVKRQASTDEILPQYDFRNAPRNKYASRYAAGSSVVVLDPDVTAAFPTERDANDALRALATIIQKHRMIRQSRRHS